MRRRRRSAAPTATAATRRRVRDEAMTRDSSGFAGVKARAHVAPTLPIWKTSANPERPGVATLQESRAFIRFVNPGDLRVVDQTCVPCHTRQVNATRRGMMAHGAMLWGAALYNNGSVPFKDPRFGEFYTQRRRAGNGDRGSCRRPSVNRIGSASCRCSSRCSAGR